MLSDNFKEIKLSDIDQGKRFREDLGDLKDLQESIRKNGLMHPIVVVVKEGNDIVREGYTSDKPYALIAGGRRFAAYEGMEEYDKIPCHIFEKEVDDLTLRILELEENIKRKDFDWKEEVNLKKQIHELYVAKFGEKTSTKKDAKGHSLRDTSEILGESVANISRDISLANALTELPDFEELKTKSEASKRLRETKRALAEQELARRSESRKAETPTAKAKKQLTDRFIVEDFFTGVNKLKMKFDLVEIDPPYSIDLQASKKSSDLKLTEYNEVDSETYIEKFIDPLLEKSFNALKDDGWLIFWFAPHPWFEDIFKAIERAGFKGTRMAGIWNKGGGQSRNTRTNLGNGYEMFFYARKGGATIIKQGRSNVYNYAPVPYDNKIHPTERPIELIEEILQTFAVNRSSILVPMAGSGNTLLAASNLDMIAVGFDITQSYKNSFALRVEEGEIGKFKSI